MVSSTRRTAGCGPACPVVWQGRVGDHSPYADVCRACLTARRCKSSSQRDGREVIAKRKGEITLAARRGLKEARSKGASRCTRTGSEAYGGGRAGKGSRSPYPSSSLVVNPAVARRRRSNLPREICRMSHNVTEGEEIKPDRAVEVSRGQTRSGSRRG